MDFGGFEQVQAAPLHSASLVSSTKVFMDREFCKLKQASITSPNLHDKFAYSLLTLADFAHITIKSLTKLIPK